ncbi:MAG: complex I NDUFA9 subunit family protein [Bdellovibrionales bacterium]|nr:complex I NDUFA9 subunit family protein [Bdellovibrionales bacterium]
MVQTLVTGGTGFIGSSIVRQLIKNRETVHVLTRNPFYVPRSRRIPGAVYIQGDVFDASSLRRAMKGCDAVINAVQFENAPFENPKKGLTYERVDGEGTVNQVDAAKESSVKRFIYISGAGVREGRQEPWFKAKLKAEKAVQESGLQWSIFRPSWIYGPEDQSLNKFSLFARISPVVPIIGSGKEKIQPVYVEDVASIISLALNAEKSFNQIFEIGGPEILTMREIVKTLLRVQGKKRLILPHPKPLMKLIASILQYFPGRPLTPGAIDFVTMEEYVDTAPLLKVFPMSLTSLQKGLTQYMGSASDLNESGRQAA